MKTKLLVFLLVLVFAFWATSYSYACMTVKPQQGCLNIEFTAVSVLDNEKTYDTADVKAQISQDRDTICVRICNAYPGYQATVKYTIKNTGNVAAQFYAPAISNSHPEALQATATSFADVVLRSGQTVQGCLTVQVLDAAQESQWYTFEVKNAVTQK